MDWVEEKLQQDGWLSPAKLQERESLRIKDRRNLAHQIVDGWHEKGHVKSLYKDFKLNLETAQTKSTTGGRSYAR